VRPMSHRRLGFEQVNHHDRVSGTHKPSTSTAARRPKPSPLSDATNDPIAPSSNRPPTALPNPSCESKNQGTGH
jgi:hypothetical protein